MRVVTVATKHGLTVSPDVRALKYSRTSSPGHIVKNDEPQALSCRRDSANHGSNDVPIEHDDPGLQVSEAKSSVPTQRIKQSKSDPMKEATSVPVHDTSAPLPMVLQPEVTQRSTQAPINEPSHDITMRSHQGAESSSYVQSALPNRSARTVRTMVEIRDARRIDDLAEIAAGLSLDRSEELDLKLGLNATLVASMDTLSYEEFKGSRSTKGRSIACTPSLKSLSNSNLDPTLANPDSLGGYFGLSGTHFRPSDSAKLAADNRADEIEHEMLDTIGRTRCVNPECHEMLLPTRSARE
jgi:hypothetical protein